MTKEYQAELVLDARATLGEGALWDATDDVLWWIDIEGRLVHRYDPATGEDRTTDVGQRIGTVVRRRRGGLTVALEHGLAHLDPTSGRLELIGDPEADRPENRFNDGKCDPAGRFWAGTMNYVHEGRPDGALYCLDATGKIEKHLEGVAISNGIVWTADARTMYYADSPTRRVDAFDFDNDRGALSNRRVAVELPENLGYPDGVAIDSADNVWVAVWAGWSVVCFDPRSGGMLARVNVPAAQVTACAFGGPDLRHLYITTARKGLDGAALAEQPNAGGVFRVRVDTPGVAAVEYAG